MTGPVIAVVDRHAESELRSGCQRRRQAERSGRQLYFVNGFFLYAVARNDRFSWTVTRWISARAGLVLNNNVPQSPFDAAQGVVVKCDLLGPCSVCNHQ